MRVFCTQLLFFLCLINYVYSSVKVPPHTVASRVRSATNPTSRRLQSTKYEFPSDHNNFQIQIVNSKDNHNSHHKLSVLGIVVNVVADLCPHGMLPLAYGISQGGPTGIIPTLLIVLLFGMMSAYTMTTYADMATATKTATIGELWGNLVGKNTQLFPELALFFLCFGGCVFYSAFIGDIFSAVGSALGIKGLISQRWVILTIISSLGLLPLCLMDDMSSLQFSSYLGVFGVLFTVFTHIKRYFDGSYAPGGKFFDMLTLAQRPRFPKPSYNMFNINSGTLTLVNMLCVAFLAHYNAINYFKELDKPTVQRYRTTIGIGYTIALGVFLSMMFVGYNIFGSVSQPLLLNNFHKSADTFATLARLGTGLAMTFAYPLLFAGLKSPLKNIISITRASLSGSKTYLKHKEMSDATFKSALAAILSVITGIAFKCSEHDVSLVLGIVGSVLGCSAAYVIPSFLRLRYLKRLRSQRHKINQIESITNHGIMTLGIVFGLLGVWITIKDSIAGHH